MLQFSIFLALVLGVVAWGFHAVLIALAWKHGGPSWSAQGAYNYANEGWWELAAFSGLCVLYLFLSAIYLQRSEARPSANKEPLGAQQRSQESRFVREQRLRWARLGGSSIPSGSLPKVTEARVGGTLVRPIVLRYTPSAALARTTTCTGIDTRSLLRMRRTRRPRRRPSTSR